MFSPFNGFVFAEAIHPWARRRKSVLSFAAAVLGLALLVGSALAFADSPASGSPAPPAKIGYNRDIRPILSENCFACHGPDKNQRKAKLRLDVREVAIEREAIVPGKPEASKVVQHIFSTDPDEIMPPPKTHKTLT